MTKLNRSILSLGLASAIMAPIAFATPKHAPAPTKNLVETAVAAGQFKTLAAALKAAGLVETLATKGPFTVFAPTDAAFAKLPKGALKRLLADKAKLTKVLLYHVVSGKVLAKQAAKLSSAKTLSGQEVHIGFTGGDLAINRSKVIKADVLATNGVIHVIDEVLIPQGL